MLGFQYQLLGQLGSIHCRGFPLHGWGANHQLWREWTTWGTAGDMCAPFPRHRGGPQHFPEQPRTLVHERRYRVLFLAEKHSSPWTSWDLVVVRICCINTSIFFNVLKLFCILFLHTFGLVLCMLVVVFSKLSYEYRTQPCIRVPCTQHTYVYSTGKW